VKVVKEARAETAMVELIFLKRTPRMEYI
jgi:hypothetical protein